MIVLGQTILPGRGVTRELGPILKKQSPSRIFLVTGRASYALSGAEAAIASAIASFETIRFSKFGSNLKLEEIAEGVRLFRDHRCDHVIGIGGGSVIDLAKAVSLLGPQPGEPSEYVTGNVLPTCGRTPSVMVPTTAGTGSESTPFSVIYIDGVKQSLSHEVMLPDYALVDPALTDSLPADVTACSGMDALCQGIESFWSVRSTETSRRLSAQAIKLALAGIVRAVNDPDEIVRDRMLQAANLSGQAISVARTTVAHAASYPLTSRYGIAHGHAVALLLPHLFEINAGTTQATLQDERGLGFVAAIMGELFEILGVDSAGEARSKLFRLMDQIGLTTRLSELGVQRVDLEAIAHQGVTSTRAGNNPRRIDEKCLLSLWREIL